MSQPRESLTQRIHAQLIAKGLMRDDRKVDMSDSHPNGFRVISSERLPDAKLLTEAIRETHSHSNAPRGQPIIFKHGLGDAVAFAHSIPLYTRRGHAVTVACTPDKREIFLAAGASVVDNPCPAFTHEYPYPTNIPEKLPADWLPFNKLWHSISHAPMPDIGRERSLWREYCDVQIDLEPFVTPTARRLVADFVAMVPRPLVVMHPQGTPPFKRRSLSAHVAETIYRRLLADTPGTLIVLDWPGVQADLRWTGDCPLIEHARVISLRRDWKPLDVMEFYCLLRSADLFIGIDSGPAHFVRYTKTPAIVCWTNQMPPFGVPAFCALPRPQTINVIPCTVRPTDESYRATYNLRESPGGVCLDGDFIADIANNTL